MGLIVGGVALTATGLGAVAGIPLIALGVADLAFSAADLQEEITGDNFLKDTVFQGNELVYAGVSIGVGIAAPSPGGKVRAVTKIAKYGDDIVAGAKKITNKYGKKGGIEHQTVIKNTAKTFKDAGYKVKMEAKVDTPKGEKSARYADLRVTDPDTGENWYIQVGKQTKSGNPVARERRAIKDLMDEGAKTIFIPYNTL